MNNHTVQPELLNKYQRNNVHIQSIHCDMDFSDVIFGDPRDDCRGAGICKIVSNMATLQLANTCRAAKAWFRVNAEQQNTQILFYKADLCATLVRYHFSQPAFRVTATVSLPEHLCPFDMPHTMVLVPGQYHIEEDQFTYRIAIPTRVL